MKFIRCSINPKLGKVIVEDTKEIEKDYNSVVEEVLQKSPKFSGYLVYPGDVTGHGIPLDPNVSREDYLNDPATYGVCIYKSWDGRVHIE